MLRWLAGDAGKVSNPQAMSGGENNDQSAGWQLAIVTSAGKQVATMVVSR